MRKRALMLIVLASAFMLVTAGSAFAVGGIVTSAGCGLVSCHSHPGYTDFASWHTNHQQPNKDIPCEGCHPNNHTTGGPPSAPDATYSLGEACNPCHVGMLIAPAHNGVTDCVTCHPAAGTLTGWVSDAGGPLVGATVSIGSIAELQTYAGGQYIGSGIPVGTYDVTFSKPGYVDRTITGVVVAFGQSTSLDARLSLTALPDLTAPVTVSDARNTYLRQAAILLFAVDTGGSGVASTKWRLDGGAWNVGTQVTSTALGGHLLEYFSTDVAGNAEGVHQARFGVKASVSVGTPVAPLSMSRYRLYTVYATLRPKHPSGSYPVRIYKWRRTASGAWKSYGYVLAKASDSDGYSRCSRAVRLSYAGRWRLRAYAPSDEFHTAAWSSGFDYVTVK